MITNTETSKITSDQYATLNSIMDKLSHHTDVSDKLNLLFVLMNDKFGDDWNHDQDLLIAVMGLFSIRVAKTHKVR